MTTIREKELQKINALRIGFTKRFYITGDNILINNIFYLPFRIKSIISDAVSQFPGEKPVLSEQDFYTIVDTFCGDLPYLYGNPNNKSKDKYEFTKYAVEACELCIRENLATKLLLSKVNKSSLTYIIEVLRTKIIDALIDPGEMIGVTSAFIASEPVQQATLNTFHVAGSKSEAKKATPIKIINSIFELSKNDSGKSMTIYLDEKHNNFETSKKVVNHIERISIKDLIEEMFIYFDINAKNIKDTGYKEDIGFIEDFVRYNTSKIPIQDLSSAFVRIKLNSNLLFRQSILIESIVDSINETYKNVYCIHSDNNHPTHVIRVHILISKLKDKSELEMCRNIIDSIGQIIIRGIPGISNISIQTKKSIKPKATDSSPEEVEEYFITTSGTNFHEICRDVKGIDTYRLYSSNILEIKQELGYEAARNVVAKELLKIYKDIGANLDWKHIELITDFITHNSSLTAITRHGMRITKHLDMFQKISFETPAKYLTDGSINSTETNTRGVEISSLLNKKIHGGTGSFELIYDTSKIGEGDEKKEDDLMKDLGVL